MASAPIPTRPRTRRTRTTPVAAATSICLLAILITGCQHRPPTGSAGPGPAASTGAGFAVSPRSRIVPLVDAHLHMMSPLAMSILSRHPSLPPITLPPELDRLLRSREAVSNPLPFDSVYTDDAIMLAEEEGRWWKGDARILDAISNLPAGLRFIPKAHQVDGAAGFISGNVSRAESSEETHSFLLGISRNGNGQWRIASEMMMPIPPPTYAPAITADRIIEVLDDAGIRYGVVLSLGYWFGAPTDPVEGRHAKTRAENDSTVAQAARYPDRLIPFCGVNPLADYAIAELERCAAIPAVRGIKIHMNNSDIELTNPQHVEGLRAFFRAANRLRLPIVAHVGGPVETLIAEVLPEAPDIPIQIAHMGSGWRNARMFADAIAAGRPGTRNLWFDWTQALPIDTGVHTPEVLARARADAAATMRRLGLDRILFGSDMPLRSNPTPREWWIKTVLTLPLTDDELRDIADNLPPYLRAAGSTTRSEVKPRPPPHHPFSTAGSTSALSSSRLRDCTTSVAGQGGARLWSTWGGLIQGPHGGEICRGHEQPLDDGPQSGADQDGIEPNQRAQPRRALQPQQASHMPRRQDRLEPQQEVIPPKAKVLAILGVQRIRALAMRQVAAQVALSIGSPAGVRPREIRDAQAGTNPVEHVVELALLVGGQRPRERLVGSLGVVDEHVEHVAVGPVRDLLAPLALHRLMDRADPRQRPRGGRCVGEDDPLRIARRGEEAADGIGRQLSGKEQPVDRAVQRELGGGAGKDQEHHVSISPDAPHDGTNLDEICDAIQLTRTSRRKHYGAPSRIRIESPSECMRL